MIRSLWIARTGLDAQQTNLDVIANNLANVSTNGFKRARPIFEDLLYQTLRQPGAQSSKSTEIPSGLQLGTGVRPISTARIHVQGSLQRTDNDLDMAIDGSGFFQIQMPDGTTAYTRDGSFERDANGTLVTVDGYSVLPGIVIPQDARDVTISAEGAVQAIVAGVAQQLGQIQTARFVNKSGLEAVGDNLFLETEASGAAQVGNPDADGFGSLQQNFLEMANVEAVSEIADLIAAQRAYEMNSRVIKAADDMYSTTTNIR